ncbi:hypothetical protein PPTG_06503 [Phytophthora nicotianae INRA-310]|uniref:Uncharacterized protein n=1 Tax=Phytophthora nicotianae (strain INRA-310) TaxID=761204 RepID=W2QTD6_PHYN3|nr:hypothetical protein PPTG_06503 [Phytophthora nicotianae INRA-310]ETN16343.1 hypothetical protein PPTG_06503 [Phytophthora nicotianae INRA-310]
MKRHLKKKKKKCDQRSKARRTNEKKERRKIQNKTYYIRRKWNISLSHVVKVLDVLLSKIPEKSEVVSANLSERLRLLKQGAPQDMNTQLAARFEDLKR